MSKERKLIEVVLEAHELRNRLRSMGARPVEQPHADFRADIRILRRKQIGMVAVRAAMERMNDEQ